MRDAPLARSLRQVLGGGPHRAPRRGCPRPPLQRAVAPLAALLAAAVATAAHAGVPAKAAEAAADAAARAPACTQHGMGDFYWEIGDAQGPLASGAAGRGSVTAGTRVEIASASKWLFGAYVVQTRGFDAVRSDPDLKDGLRFLSGNTDFKQMRCMGRRTVGACWEAGNGGEAPHPDPRTIGKFDYESGHDQKLAAIDLQMAAMNADEVTRAYRQALHLDDSFSMAGLDPLMAGGMYGTAEGYAAFLRRLMRGELELGRHLGEDAVCAQPRTCPSEAVQSPISFLGEPWRYSYNHWVEQRHEGTVDAYSSPGRFGFYPWISADKRFYGVLSRFDRSLGAYIKSAQCGRAIRDAFLGAL
jgi:CubicO group peptidase (beta-lactamase class C family)